MRLIVAAILSAAFFTNTIASDLFSKNWSPSLNDVISHLENELKEAKGQQVINRISRRLAETYDAQLALVYFQLWQKTSTKKQALIEKEQEDWIAKRDKAVTEASHWSEGGSVAPFEANTEFIKLTQQRIKEFQVRLKATDKEPSK